MCGFVGGTNRNWNYPSALQSIFHRGPDDKDTYTDNMVTLAFCRLSIIDLDKRANQPMLSADNRLKIVFNGEIYDFKSLRKELESKGHIFRTTSDTEVLLTSYIEWGESFVDHFDGMFAIAILDSDEKKIKLYRDRTGIKPLYYYYDGNNFAFSSELKAISSLCKNETLDYDYTALYDYLTYMYIPEPKTLYKNTYKLKPAHKLIYDLRSQKILKEEKYWSLNTAFTLKYENLDSLRENLRFLVHESVKNQLVADVPVGLFLSGGLDSSIVAIEAVSVDKHISSFSIGFQDERHSETHFAKIIANKFRLNHHEKILSNPATENLLSKILQWYDEPFADTSCFPTFLVSKFAKRNVKVVLTGDGGDEIFGGYKWYEHHLGFQDNRLVFKEFLHSITHNIKTFFPFGSFPFKCFNELEYAMLDPLACHAKILGGMLDQEKGAYRQAWSIPKDYDSYWYFREHYQKDLPLRTRLQYLDFHTYLPSDILTKVDRTSMAVSLEARVPLLGKDLVEFCFSLPESIRYYNGQLKGFLKESYRELLPKAILTRKKKGFSIPKAYLQQNEKRKQERILEEVFRISV